MKKLLIFAVFYILASVSTSLMLAEMAEAGTPGCSNVKTVVGDYEASPSDCIIRVQNPFSFTSSVVLLPDGGDFTVQDDSDFANDACETYDDGNGGTFTFCYPAGITIRAASGNYTIDSAQDTTLSGLYFLGSPTRQSVQLADDGLGNWTAAYGYWR